jgi:hypothetical protein
MSERLALGLPVDAVLDRLYTRNDAQNDTLTTYFTTRAAEGSLDWNLAFVQDPRNRLRTMTLPFEGGLEFTVRAH